MKKVQDSYFHRAKQAGFAARSVYKLEEIDRKKRLIKTGQRILDLGCAPGSWLQYAAQRVGPKGTVLGVDLQAVEVALPAGAKALQADVFALDAKTLREAAGLEGRDGGPLGGFDLVLSDMAPKTTGIPSADAARSADLALQALALAQQALKPGGDLLVKVFQGARLQEVRKAFASAFDQVTLEKPAASRSESVEIFVLGRGMHAAPASRISSPQPASR